MLNMLQDSAKGDESEGSVSDNSVSEKSVSHNSVSDNSVRESDSEEEGMVIDEYPKAEMWLWLIVMGKMVNMHNDYA